MTSGDLFDCTIDELNGLSWDARIWWIGKLGEAAGSPGWFENIQTILAFFRDTPELSDLTGWASAADAPLLWVIQQGYRIASGDDRAMLSRGHEPSAAQKWAKFFSSVGRQVEERFALWGEAETVGTLVGIGYADAKGLRPSGKAGVLISEFTAIGDDYRQFLATGTCDCPAILHVYFTFCAECGDPRTDAVRRGADYALSVANQWEMDRTLPRFYGPIIVSPKWEN